MDLGLADKVALVTAASKGLGRAAPMEFARQGARVAICARSEQLEVTAEEIRNQTGAQVLAVRADLTKPADIESLVETTLNRLGQIDILIINAGGPPPGNFLDLKPEDWEAAVNLTLMSAVRLCYAVVPHMLERGSGSIVSTQSVSVKQPVANLILPNSLRMAVIRRRSHQGSPPRSPWAAWGPSRSTVGRSFGWPHWPPHSSTATP